MTETKTEDKGAETTATTATTKTEEGTATTNTGAVDTEKLTKKNSALIADLQKEREERKNLADKVAAFEKQKADAEAAEAEKNGEFKKLLDLEKANKEKEVGGLSQKIEGMKKRLILSELKALAVKEGVRDPDVVSLMKFEDVKISDDLEITGAEDVVKAFKAAKPSLFEPSADQKAQEAATKARTTGAATKTVVDAGSGSGGDVVPGSKEAAKKLSDFASKFG